MYFMRIICGSKRPGKAITPICLIIFMYIGDNFGTYKVNHVSKIYQSCQYCQELLSYGPSLYCFELLTTVPTVDVQNSEPHTQKHTVDVQNSELLTNVCLRENRIH